MLIISEKLVLNVVLSCHVADRAKVVVTATGTLPSHSTEHVFSTTRVAHNSSVHHTYRGLVIMLIQYSHGVHSITLQIWS